MIYSEDLFTLEDQAKQLATVIIESDLLGNYKKCRSTFLTDEKVLIKQQNFLKLKEKFEQIESYGSYAPDFKKVRKELSQAKRELDMADSVAELKYSETDVQNLLDEIGQKIAKQISETIKIDAGNPFFSTAAKGCSGNCHVG